MAGIGLTLAAPRAQLHREAQPVVIRSAPCDQVPIGVIEVEEPLQLQPLRVPDETPGRRHLLIAQELHRHESRP